jgi:hypothetical protein
LQFEWLISDNSTIAGYTQRGSIMQFDGMRRFIHEWKQIVITRRIQPLWSMWTRREALIMKPTVWIHQRNPPKQKKKSTKKQSES